MLKTLPPGYSKHDFVWRESFYRDPDAIRSWILDQEFETIGQFSFPGWQMKPQLVNDSIIHLMEDAMPSPIDRCDRGVTFGGIRAMTEQSSSFSRVHADTVTPWAAMVYLTPGLGEHNGTGFFKHVPSGLIGPPSWLECLELGYGSPSHFIESEIQPDSTNPEKWELTFTAPATYNAYVAFRGDRYFHAPLQGTGDSPMNARLTHQFFFRLTQDLGRDVDAMRRPGPCITDTEFLTNDGSGGDFSGFQFNNVDFTGAVLRGTVFKGCKLVNCNFTRTDLSAASFNGAEVKRCNFYQSELYSSDWRNASVDDSLFTDAHCYALAGGEYPMNTGTRSTKHA